ncbi:hypothetical protein ACXIUS_30155 [Bosea thiooxidans]
MFALMRNRMRPEALVLTRANSFSSNGIAVSTLPLLPRSRYSSICASRYASTAFTSIVLSPGGVASLPFTSASIDLKPDKPVARSSRISL